MLVGNLKMLDMDAHLVPTFQNLHDEALERACERGLILDCATSDVTIYLERPDGSDGSFEDYDYVLGGHYENNRWVEASHD
jgi:hypothetical protein